jgi:rare lipoprotein A
VSRAAPPPAGPPRVTAAAALLALLLGACATHSGRYYRDDGPPERAPADLASVPDAVPRVEPINPNANRPYAALGHSYTPDTGDAPFEQRGIASWYGRRYHGSPTSSGETYDMFAMTAAHPTLPIPSYARVTSVHDGRSVVVRINDRGPFLENRVIDLSYAAALRLGIASAGSGEVVVHKITAREIAAGGAAAAPLAVAAAASTAASPPLAAAAAPARVANAALSASSAVAAVPAAVEAPVALATPIAATAAVAVDPLVALTTAPIAPPAAATGAPEGKDAAGPGSASTRADALPAGRPPQAPAGTVSADPVQPPAVPPRDASWSVQVGAFAIESNALMLRDVISRQLAAAGAQALPALARIVRIEQTGGLSRVLVGPASDHSAAQALAQQLGRLLARETSLYQHLVK